VKPYNPYQPSKQEDGSRGPSAPLPQTVTRSLECGAVARHRNPSIPSGASLHGAVFGCRREIPLELLLGQREAGRAPTHICKDLQLNPTTVSPWVRHRNEESPAAISEWAKVQPSKCSQQVILARKNLPQQPFRFRKRKKQTFPRIHYIGQDLPRTSAPIPPTRETDP
jgi:hypothetical protein